MQKTIAILPGDGIGSEIMSPALKILNKIAENFGHTFNFKEALIGGRAYDVYGQHLPEETISVCKNSDAILFGAVGGPVDKQTEAKWNQAEKNSILGLRKTFSLFANLRPSYIYQPLSNISILKKNIIEQGIDIMIVRELISGLYFGEHKTEDTPTGKKATDIMEYHETDISNIISVAIDVAQTRRKKITLVDKANVLDCSILWRQVAKKILADYPDIELEFMYVDNAAMQLVKKPQHFDVIVTENMFGDILSDLTSTFAGSIGLVPSASLNKDNFGLYEPISGSAPDIAGQNIANPIGQILSAAMMLKYSFNLITESEIIEQAVIKTLTEGIRTADIMEEGCKKVGTEEMGEEIGKRIKK